MIIPNEFINETIEFRHVLHQNAELSLHEDKTKALIVEKLENFKNINVKNMGNWIFASYKSKNPTGNPIAFRADFDALPIEETIDKPYASLNPNVSHRCGHDGHAACLVGLAELVNKYGSDRDIYFCFQHAEEIGAGGEKCADYLASLENKPEFIYAFHNWSGFKEGEVIVKSGSVHCASKGVTYKFIGKNSHASQPEDGNNPAFAIAEFINHTKLDSIDKGESLLLATIVDISLGDKNFGISPGVGSVSVTLRGEDPTLYKTAENYLVSSAQSIAEKYGLTVEISECDVFPETINTEKAAQNIRFAAKNAGVYCSALDKPFRSSEDFGYYTRKTDGAIFYVGNGLDYPAIHTIEYDFNDNIIATVLKMFATLGEVKL